MKLLLFLNLAYFFIGIILFTKISEIPWQIEKLEKFDQYDTTQLKEILALKDNAFKLTMKGVKKAVVSFNILFLIVSITNSTVLVYLIYFYHKNRNDLTAY